MTDTHLHAARAPALSGIDSAVEAAVSLLRESCGLSGIGFFLPDRAYDVCFLVWIDSSGRISERVLRETSVREVDAWMAKGMVSENPAQWAEPGKAPDFLTEDCARDCGCRHAVFAPLNIFGDKLGLALLCGEESGTTLAEKGLSVIERAWETGRYSLLEEKLAGRTGLASVVVHDLRNPLASMGLFFEMAASDNPGLREHSRAMLGDILKEREKMSLLLESFSALNKIEAARAGFQPVSCDLREAIEGVAEVFASTLAEDGCELAYPEVEKGLMLTADPQLLSQLLQHLICDLAGARRNVERVRVELEKRERSCVLRLSHDRDWDGREELEAIMEGNLKEGKCAEKSENRLQAIIFKSIGRILDRHGFDSAVETLPCGRSAFAVRLPLD